MTRVFRLDNPNLDPKSDYLYHLGIRPADAGIQTTYSDVKFVLLGGKSTRMKVLAKLLFTKLGQPSNSAIDQEGNLRDVAADGGRYEVYKVGPCLVATHGIGIPSMNIVMQELFKLLHYAGASGDTEVIRIGSSGGVGIEAGTVVVTRQPYSDQLKPTFDQVSCGESIPFPSRCDPELGSRLIEAARQLNLTALEADTCSTNDFYEGQGRSDGALCWHGADASKQERSFLERVHAMGVRNFEMEAIAFAAICNRVNLKCAVVCTVLVDRLDTSVPQAAPDTIREWDRRAGHVVTEHVMRWSVTDGSGKDGSM